MNTLLQDIRYGLRMLRKSPGLTFIAIFILAIGIGANTAIFSVVNGVVLRPLPFYEPEQLVRLQETSVRAGGLTNASPPNFIDWQMQNTVFEHLTAYYGRGTNITGAGDPVRILSVAASADFFPMLGVRPILGRTFTREEDHVGRDQVAVLTHVFWQQYFGGAPDIVGRSVTVDSQSYTVIGVMPPGFYYPRDASLAFWTPLAPDRNPSRGSHYLTVIGRLKPGVTATQAQAGMNLIARQLENQYPNSNRGNGVAVSSLHEETVGEIRQTLFLLMGAVGFVLMIACANVANLQVARATGRQKEIAVRAALGAGRSRIIRQLITESLMLNVIGGALGLLLATWGVKAFIALAPQSIPRVEEIGIDGQALAFTLVLSVLTGILSGLSPAFQVSKHQVVELLKTYSRSGTAGPRQSRMRDALVVVEIGLALVMLIGAGLMMRSFVRLIDVDPGVDPKRVLTMTIALPDSKYSQKESMRTFYQELLPRIASIPGVESAGLASHLPLSGTEWTNSFRIAGRPPLAPDEDYLGDLRWVSAGYFETMGISLLKGRMIDDRDAPDRPGVVIVNQAFVRRYFPAADPIGQQLNILYGPPGGLMMTIVGVVGNIRPGMDRDAAPEMYLSFVQSPVRALTLAVRASGDPAGLAPAIRREVQALDSGQPVANIRTMEEILSASIAPWRFNTIAFGLFALIALALAGAGLYGVILYLASQRTREIGIRIAFGAQPADVLKLVIGQGMRLTLIGIVIGIAGALALTQLMSNLLYGVQPTDPATFIVISLLLAFVALLACYIPARRAMRVDPMAALRYE